MTPPRRSALHGASPQFLRYVLAGATGTAVHYALLIVLVQLASVGAVAATTAGAVSGALVNYRLNHRFTFESDQPHKHALPRFALVALLGIAINAAVVALLLPWVVPYYLLAQVAATGVVLITGFAVNRAWTF
jgi:putative flippase GtrA